MGAQVIFAVRHDMLHLLDDTVRSAMGRHASHLDLTPRHFEPSLIDRANRVHLADGSEKKGMVTSYHHDMDQNVCLLINHDFICSLDAMMSLATGDANNFGDVARLVNKHIKRGSYPFGRNDTTLKRDAEPAPVVHGAGAMTLFSYYTDDFSWSGEKGQHALADVIHYCRTGVAMRRSMGWNTEHGFMNGCIRPLITLSASSMALTFVHQGAIQVLVLPQRDLKLDYKELGIDLSDRNHKQAWKINRWVFSKLMAAHGYSYRQKPALDHTLLSR